MTGEIKIQLNCFLDVLSVWFENKEQAEEEESEGKIMRLVPEDTSRGEINTKSNEINGKAEMLWQLVITATNPLRKNNSEQKKMIIL